MNKPLPFVRKKNLKAVEATALKASSYLVDAFVDKHGVVNMDGIETALVVMVAQYFKQLANVEGKAFALEAFNQFLDFLKNSTMDCLKKGGNQ
ncbi:MAG: hypothetical protein ABFD50_08245 [Smithella sp.]